MPQSDYFSSLRKGDSFSSELRITEDLMGQFGLLSGDFNPLHINDDFARRLGFVKKVCYGNILGFLVSHLVGMKLGCEEVMLISQKIDYKSPMYSGNIISLKGEITEKSQSVRIITLALSFSNELGTVVATGKCQVRFFENAI